ncbi:hypothetical protein E9228_001541 [Curtobacterium flaccumfaciens]|uniref:GmrSD restriction endonucleases N-terminal domain-containing protein n=1 Tax=Curtobacterium salicis TaxID=1779862 RepID=A0ABX0T5Z2_9MICO|nr:DUF262 domain-containing protein [Curtobacterium sp. WW7]NII40905.1 hypothetical protein [Curtobacterium sp. WW7]
MARVEQDLAVRSESVQRLYGLYIADRFEVNRRYQRKLVWSVEEKQKLVDSMLRDLPLPLFLVAELTTGTDASLELIDGLQRLNAIFAFLENEYPINGKYFDLDALADTKLMKDEGRLEQKEPKLEREASTDFVNYTVALSVYRAADQASIEEVFRRINSGGRRLSRQSLRQAGTVSSLADLVRVLSSEIRGDTSPTDSVPLRRMPQLSISNYDLDYGVVVDEIFWVENGILRREDVRESLDEQLILDLLIDVTIEPTPSSGTRVRDAYYSYGDIDSAESAEAVAIAASIDLKGAGAIKIAFKRAYDAVRTVVRKSDKKFSNLVGAGPGGRNPRYFHITFLAFYELINVDRLRLNDVDKAVKALTKIGGAALNVPGGGGDWTAKSKRATVDAVKGVLRSSFEGPVDGDDLGSFGYASQLEVLLGNARVEQQLFDCKQGLFTLASNDRKFDPGALATIARTLAAMANMGKGAVGYVAVGIADDKKDAERVEELDGVNAIEYRKFLVVGVEREALLAGKPLNDYWHWITQKLAGVGLDPALLSQVLANARLVPYEGRVVLLFKVSALAAPIFFEGQLWERAGSQTVLVQQADYARVFGAFTA